jgi:hypothetical protein
MFITIIVLVILTCAVMWGWCGMVLLLSMILADGYGRFLSISLLLLLLLISLLSCYVLVLVVVIDYN